MIQQLDVALNHCVDVIALGDRQDDRFLSDVSAAGGRDTLHPVTLTTCPPFTHETQNR